MTVIMDASTKIAMCSNYIMCCHSPLAYTFTKFKVLSARNTGPHDTEAAVRIYLRSFNGANYLIFWIFASLAVCIDTGTAIRHFVRQWNLIIRNHLIISSQIASVFLGAK